MNHSIKFNRGTILIKKSYINHCSYFEKANILFDVVRGSTNSWSTKPGIKSFIFLTASNPTISCFFLKSFHDIRVSQLR